MSFERLKKAFDKWRKNPTPVTYPKKEILIECKGVNLFDAYRVIKKQGKLILDYVLIAENINRDDLVNKYSEYKHNFAVGELPLLK